MKRSLYLLGTSPHTRTDRFPILETAEEGDAVLLHQDGVLGLKPLHPLLQELRSRGVRLVSSEPDCRARGIAASDDAVGWEGFVELVVSYERVVS